MKLLVYLILMTSVFSAPMSFSENKAKNPLENQEKSSLWKKIFKESQKPKNSINDPTSGKRDLSHLYKRKSEEQLNMELNRHMKRLKRLCKKKNEEEEIVKKFKKRILKLKTYLTSNLKDYPLMSLEIRRVFGDILDVIDQDVTMESADDFITTYKNHLNLPEDMKPKDYPDDWAQELLKVYECVYTKEIES